MADLSIKAFTKCKKCKEEVDLFDTDDCLILTPDKTHKKGDLYNLFSELRDHLTGGDIYIEYECLNCNTINEVIHFNCWQNM